MKFELRTKKWFICKDTAKIVQGLITKREMLETHDLNDGECSFKRYFLQTDWQDSVWINEEDLFDTISDLSVALFVPCSFD